MVLKILSPIPVIGEPMKALDMYHKVKFLENASQFNKAQALRDKAVSSLKPKYLGPILRSEGMDKLYRLKDYKSAIKSLEKAENTLKVSPMFYGVSQPDAILSGIAISAYYLGDIEKAQVYRDKFVELYEGMKKYSKREGAFKWHENTIRWLNKSINSKI